MTLHRIEGAWPRRAACRGPDARLFYPPAAAEPRPAREAREHQAKAICAVCPVREPCLTFALDTREPHGILGGMSEAEREAILEPRAG